MHVCSLPLLLACVSHAMHLDPAGSNEAGAGGFA